MKRILGIALALASLGFAGVSAEAKAGEVSRSAVTLAANASPQWQRDGYRGRVRRRTVTRTRVVRQGRRVFRETYQITYLPNGRTDTRLISRVRIA